MSLYYTYQMGEDLLRLAKAKPVDFNVVYAEGVPSSDNASDSLNGKQIICTVSFISDYVRAILTASRYFDCAYWIKSAEKRLNMVIDSVEALRKTRSTWNDSRIMLGEIRIDQLRRIIIEFKSLEVQINSK